MYSSSEIIAKGQKIYDAVLKPQLEPHFDGKLLALDIDSGEYTLGDDTLSAFDNLKGKYPNAIVYLLRVGHAATIQFGGSSLDLFQKSDFNSRL